MGWVIFFAVVAYIVFRLFSNRDDGSEKAKNMISIKPAAQREKDEFAGNSIGAFFLLEEVIDPDTRKSKSVTKENLEDEWLEDQHVEDEWLDDDFIEEEFYE